MAADAYSIGQLIASMGLDPTQFNAGMASANAKMQAADAKMKATSASMTASLTKVGMAMQKVGKVMTRSITLPIIALGTISTKTFADFEAAMAKIEGLVGVSAEEVDNLTKSVLKLSPAVGRGPVELADALFFIESAGIRGAEAMQVLEMSAKASVAGLGETKVIADLVTSAMNAYGSANLSAAEATDTLVATVREGKAEAADIAGAMGQVLPIASEFGVSFQQVGAAFAGMTRTGTKARVAATQVKAILATMAKPTEKATKAMKDMDYSADQFRKTIREKGLMAALVELRDITSEYGEDALPSVIPNIRALMGALDITGFNMEDNIAIAERMVDNLGDTDKAYEVAAKTIKQRFNVALATLKTSFVTVGKTMKEIIVPLLEKVTGAITKATEWFDNLSAAQKQTALRVTALVAALGPLLVIAGKLVANPWIALATAIAYVAFNVAKMIKHNKELKEGYDAVAVANKKASEEFADQSAEVLLLTARIEDENAANSTKIRAIERLKKLVPEYNGSLTDEGVLINHNTDAINNYLKALERKIRMQAFEAEYTALLKKQIKAQEDLEKAREAQTDAHTEWIKAGKPAVQYITTMAGSIAKTAKVTHGLKTATGIATNAVFTQKEAVHQLDLSMQDLIDTMNSSDFVIPGLVTPEVPDGGEDGEDGGEDPNKINLEALERLREVQAERLSLIAAGRQAEVDVIMDGHQQAIAQAELDYFNQIGILQKKAKEFPELEGQINTLIEQITAEHLAIIKGLYETNAADIAKNEKEAAEQSIADLTESNAAKISVWEEFGTTMTNVFNGIGSAVALANNKVAQWVTYTGRVIGAAAKMIAAIKKVAAAKAIAAQIDAVKVGAPVPFPGNLLAIASSVAAVVGALAAIPKFAAGGIVSGPTVGMMGEYPGARSNPEVIAPLDKLQSMLQPKRSTGEIPKEVKLVMEGRDAVAWIDFNKMLNNTY